LGTIFKRCATVCSWPRTAHDLVGGARLMQRWKRLTLVILAEVL